MLRAFRVRQRGESNDTLKKVRDEVRAAQKAAGDEAEGPAGVGSHEARSLKTSTLTKLDTYLSQLFLANTAIEDALKAETFLRTLTEERDVSHCSPPSLNTAALSTEDAVGQLQQLLTAMEGTEAR